MSLPCLTDLVLDVKAFRLCTIPLDKSIPPRPVTMGHSVLVRVLPEGWLAPSSANAMLTQYFCLDGRSVQDIPGS